MNVMDPNSAKVSFKIQMDRRKIDENRFSINLFDSDDDDVICTSHTILPSEVGSAKKDSDVKVVKRGFAVSNPSSVKKIKFEDFTRKFYGRSGPEQNKLEQKANNHPQRNRTLVKNPACPLNNPRYDRRNETVGAKSDRDNKNDERYKKKEKDDRARNGGPAVNYGPGADRRNEREDRGSNGEREKDRSRGGERRLEDQNRERRIEPRPPVVSIEPYRVDRDGNSYRERRDSEKRNEGRDRSADRNREIVPIPSVIPLDRNKKDDNGGKIENNERIDKPAEPLRPVIPWKPIIENAVPTAPNNDFSRRQTPILQKQTDFNLTDPSEGTITVKNVIVTYREPPEAMPPKKNWKLYLITGAGSYSKLHINTESAYLIGRDKRTDVDFVLDHPSCSRRHAILQYLLVPFTRDDGTIGKRLRPFLFDLDSTNGTYINHKKIEPRKYIELMRSAVITFGSSSWDYVLVLEDSKDGILDDDVKDEERRE